MAGWRVLTGFIRDSGQDIFVARSMEESSDGITYGCIVSPYDQVPIKSMSYAVAAGAALPGGKCATPGFWMFKLLVAGNLVISRSCA